MSEQTCPGCGKQLAESVRFCPDCGARMPEPPAAPPQHPVRPGEFQTVVLPPVGADAPAESPPPIPPTVRLDLPTPQPATPQPATPQLVLPQAAGEGAPAAPKRRRTLWWILGGVGCLSLLLIGTCVGIGSLLFINQAAVGTPPPSTTAPVGVGGIVPDIAPRSDGAILLEDDFSSAEALSLDVSEDETSRSAYEDGAYKLVVKAPETVVWSLVPGTYANVRITVDAIIAEGADITAAGVIFNYLDGDNFYLYTVSSDGYYALEALQDGEWTVLIDPTLAPEVDSVRNTLGVETRDNRIALYVNGSLLEETSDDTFTVGEVGLAASSFQASPSTVSFDNLVIASNE